jgi:hypothetical protein
LPKRKSTITTNIVLSDFSILQGIFCFVLKEVDDDDEERQSGPNEREVCVCMCVCVVSFIFYFNLLYVLDVIHLDDFDLELRVCLASNIYIAAQRVRVLEIEVWI